MDRLPPAFKDGLSAVFLPVEASKRVSVEAYTQLNDWPFVLAVPFFWPPIAW